MVCVLWSRGGSQRLREAVVAPETDATLEELHAALDEEVLRARMIEKRQRRMARTIGREQSRSVRAMAGLPSKEEDEEASDRSDKSSSEQICLDPFYVFEHYIREKDSKGNGKGKGSRG